jgi:hypothetical protein
MNPPREMEQRLYIPDSVFIKQQGEETKDLCSSWIVSRNIFVWILSISGTRGMLVHRLVLCRHFVMPQGVTSIWGKVYRMYCLCEILSFAFSCSGQTDVSFSAQSCCINHINNNTGKRFQNLISCYAYRGVFHLMNGESESQSCAVLQFTMPPMKGPIFYITKLSDGLVLN